MRSRGSLIESTKGDFNGITDVPGRTVRLSNLCTEIIEVTSANKTAVCNLGSINLSKHITVDKTVDWEKLARTVLIAVRQRDQVIDLNDYVIPNARTANEKWRPFGLGLMGG